MYMLVDSGEGEKLERFGDRLLRRPSSICIWKRRADPAVWSKADATFVPKSGWKFKGSPIQEWSMPMGNATVILRLQNNGQIGVFPEHATYLDELVGSLKASGSQPKMLSLFAYTGLATVTALKAGAEVTHVDALKSALDWARENIDASQIKDPKVRLIPEEALTFVKREIKREKSYDIILADPPSFSRVGKNSEWDLLEVLPDFLKDLVSILSKDGALYFTCHLTDAGSTIVENLLRDLVPGAKIESRGLFLPEEKSDRKLPAGQLIRLKRKMSERS